MPTHEHTQWRTLALMETRLALDAETKPQLKTGTLVIARGENTYVGRSDYGIEYEGAQVRSILACFSGTRTCSEIAHELACDLDNVTSLVAELDALHFLDTQKSAIVLSDRYRAPGADAISDSGLCDDNLDATFQQIKSRIRPELSLTTWGPEVRDGGVSLMSARQDQPVLIYGNSRIAILLYGILLSSGLSQTTLISDEPSRLIGDIDLCGGFLRLSDIGSSQNERITNIRPELSLFPLNCAGSKNPREIAISVGPPTPELLQMWMSECIPHLFIEDPECASITIGPLVIPGRTPCWRCTALTQDDEHIAWTEVQWQRRIAPRHETPVSVAHHVAGLAALELLHFIDTGNSDLLGSTFRINYLSAIDAKYRTFLHHPACGCRW